MKRVLVTGASGFIGRHAIGHLIEQGYRVEVVSRRDEQWLPGVGVHNVDLLTDARRLIESVRPTHLLHFAWSVVPPAYSESPENFRWVAASLELLHAFAASGGQRAVFAGSCAEYDWSGDCCGAQTVLRPRTIYGVCKNALRELFEAACAAMSISGAWGRIFFVYGPHEAPQRLVPSAIRGIGAGEIVPCTDGLQQRDFLFVDDVASAFVALLGSDVTGGVDIGSGTAVPVREVVTRIADQMNGHALIRLGALPRPEQEPAIIRANTERLFGEAGWTPRWTLEAGLAKTIEWWTR